MMSMFSASSADISTHALTEGDSNVLASIGGSVFQLTPSRRATCQSGIRLLCCNISTHALTEGDIRVADTPLFFPISTHALTEGDEKRFRPCPSMGISTHALTEGDFRFLQCGFNCV